MLLLCVMMILEFLMLNEEILNELNIDFFLLFLLDLNFQLLGLIFELLFLLCEGFF